LQTIGRSCEKRVVEVFFGNEWERRKRQGETRFSSVPVSPFSSLHFALKRENNQDDDSPSNHIFRLSTQPDILREPQLILPIDNLPIRIMSVLGTKRWVPDQAFKHDRTQTPPITLLTITLL